ncbi:LacI family DNA-binding transcriptional regulator [Curtobacterium sp. Leaf261]|uniref:LacI family DNA-binding transcriptional regulator n=1 Tax=Curtobacterium sp. Leaf261 TaxID=1736311 RepID=UPI000B0ED3FD|nr:LacI family DNA-binding transcriptional regulator [Curtobacterium sp. Leaf261]
MATIRAVASRAGVSVGTVSNVINRPSYVNPETRDRVLAAIADLDFIPTQYRRQFRPGRERVIGCVLANMENPSFIDVAMGIDDEASSCGVGVVITHSAEDSLREQHNFDLLMQLRVHGLIVAPVQGENPRLEELVIKGVPLVYIDRFDSEEKISSVVVDRLVVGQLAGEHLIGLGHRDVGFVSGPIDSHFVRNQLHGLRSAVDSSDDVARPVRVLSAVGWYIADGLAAAEEFLSIPYTERPTAVFCANDKLAVGFIRGCHEVGIRVPHDVSVVSYDDLASSADAPVPLTTIRPPRSLMGRSALQMLLRKIDNPTTDVERLILQPDLIIHESTGRRTI